MCDFILSHAIWPEGTAGLKSTRNEQTMLRDLTDVANEWFLIQRIELPTHRKGITIDLVFSNDPLLCIARNPWILCTQTTILWRVQPHIRCVIQMVHTIHKKDYP